MGEGLMQVVTLSSSMVSPPLLTPLSHTHQALLYFLQDSILFVMAWVQKVHSSLPQTFKERDTQRACNILQVLRTAERS